MFPCFGFAARSGMGPHEPARLFRWPAPKLEAWFSLANHSRGLSLQIATLYKINRP